MSEVCSTCGLPEELCVCDDGPGEIELTIYTGSRGNRPVTFVDGFENNRDERASVLKQYLACGGGPHDGEDVEPDVQSDEVIMLQGHHENTLQSELEGNYQNKQEREVDNLISELDLLGEKVTVKIAGTPHTQD